eukprot:SAG11_NODE_1582_length_4646_cov_3.855949_7_plen_78_part_00
MPRIGPISGEMSIEATVETDEFVASPTAAMIAAIIRFSLQPSHPHPHTHVARRNEGDGAANGGGTRGELRLVQSALA